MKAKMNGCLTALTVALFGVATITAPSLGATTEKTVIGPGVVEYRTTIADTSAAGTESFLAPKSVATTESVVEREEEHWITPEIAPPFKRAARSPRVIRKRQIASARPARSARRRVATRIVQKPVFVEKKVFVDRPIERVVEKAVVVEKPVFIEKPVVIERRVEIEKPVIQQTIIERPVIQERVIEKPVIQEKVIERPVFIEKKHRKHLLRLGLF
jgi:UDP-3-O-[3-hydroxymyristoyl] glucosamine N-acyltransferase